MTVFIKNMVCDRCIFAIENELKSLGITFKTIQLGEINFGSNELSNIQMNDFGNRIEKLGFEILNDKTNLLIEKIKLSIQLYLEIECLTTKKQNFSDYLSFELNSNYSFLSNLFSSVVGLTIEQYLIQLKIEKVKELLIYDEFSLSEISYKLKYSSVAHVSNQFKKFTGMRPSEYKKLRGPNKRKSLDKLYN